jgi:hypothetical protein
LGSFTTRECKRVKGNGVARVQAKLPVLAHLPNAATAAGDGVAESAADAEASLREEQRAEEELAARFAPPNKPCHKPMKGVV